MPCARPDYTQKAEAFNENATKFETLNDFLAFLEKLFADSYNALKDGGKIGFLIPNQCHIDLNGEPFIDLPFLAYERLVKAGFIPFRRIFVPLTVVQYQDFDMARAKRERILLALWRELLVFGKAGDGVTWRNKN